MKSTRLPVILFVLVLVATGFVRPVVAHDVAPDPVVDMTVRPNGGTLNVHVTLPLAALADANLPLDRDGGIASLPGSPELNLVGRNIASDLELQQDEVSLDPPTIRTTVAPTVDAVVVDLEYTIRQDAGRVSARLQAFRSSGLIVPTTAHYEAGGGTRTWKISGDPERVDFEPRRLQAIQHVIRLGIATLFSTGVFGLFVLCLVAPRRRTGLLFSAVGAIIAGQSLVVLLQGAGILQFGPQVSIALSAVAASALAVAALLSITAPGSRWFTPLAALFGAAHGASVGGAFLADSAYAGSHLGIAVVVFVAVVSLGQVWAAALLSSATALVFRWGLPERITAIGIAILVGHSALHLAADQGQLLAGADSATPDRAMVLMAIGWAAVILCAGIVEATFGRGEGRHSSAPAAILPATPGHTGQAGRARGDR